MMSNHKVNGNNPNTMIVEDLKGVAMEDLGNNGHVEEKKDSSEETSSSSEVRKY